MSAAWSRLRARLAPALSGALIAGMLVVGGTNARPPEHVDAYHARVRDAVLAVPYRIGSFVGVNTESSVAAVRLLRPNAMLQRQYTDPETGHSVALLIVHCGDVRDMLGHYPPVCYPAHGWRQERVTPDTITVNGQRMPARRYEFARTDMGLEQRMEILNFFVMPASGAQVLPDMEELNRASRAHARAGLGSAQVQMLGLATLPSDRRESVKADFVRAIEPVIRAIAEGAGND